MLAGIVRMVTAVAPPRMGKDRTTGRDSPGHKDWIPPAATAPAPPPAPTLEQIRYMEGLRTATRGVAQIRDGLRSEEHTSELQSPCNLVCRLLLEKKKKQKKLT